MVIYNAATKELTAKIVYYGPGLCGKTTNLKVLHDRLEPGTVGKLLNLQTQTDRTIYFDLLPVELGDIKGYKIRFQLATVPGQTAFNETRRVVLKGVDGIVFVADSQWTMLPKNLESWQNLKDNLKTNEITFESIPVVVQYNKRDLADILAVDAMQEALGLSSYPFVEAVASAGRGVTETFKLISKLTFVDLLRRLQGRRAEEAGAAALASELEESPQDALQSWKDSLLHREPPATQAPPVQRLSRPLSLVPPVSDEAPFDTTELSRGVDDEEPPSPYSVPEPPLAESADAFQPASSAETLQMEAVELEAALPEPEEVLSEADEVEMDAPTEVEIDVPTEVEPAMDPAFLAPEPAADGQIERLERRLQAAEEGAGRERNASERIGQTVAALQERADASSTQLGGLAERLGAMEKGIAGLQETIGGLLQRLVQTESDASRHPELERSLRGLEAGLRDIDDRLRAETTHQRKDADDVAMALRGLNERSQSLDQQLTSLTHQVTAHQEALTMLSGMGDRVPSLETQLAGLRELAAKLPELEAQVQSGLRQHHELEAKLPELEAQVQNGTRQHHELESALEEKTHQGRREAEDIRSQLAPLLEDRVRRHESDALLFSEMERLRESLAESLHDLAERLRHAVRGS